MERAFATRMVALFRNIQLFIWSKYLLCRIEIGMTFRPCTYCLCIEECHSAANSLMQLHAALSGDRSERVGLGPFASRSIVNRR
jgi:hypothetical protein